MKQCLLFCVFSALVFVGSAQTYGFGTAGNCSLPAGFDLSQGAKVGSYNNPNNACAEDCGIITPGVGGNNPANIAFPPSPVSGSKANICFDIFAFQANLKCENDVLFPCNGAGVTVIAYIVAADYNKTSAPTAAEYFGKSEPTIIIKNSNVCIGVTFSNGTNNGGDYRIFLDFTAPDNCLQSGIKYVIDNIKVTYVEESPLPVSLKSFTANRTGNAVLLTWETLTEWNNKGFAIQRNDGTGWKDISFIATKAAEGNSNNSIVYSYSDINTTNGLSQYRILQTDRDGRKKASEIVTVRNKELSNKNIVHPNPSNNGTVMITFDENNSIRDVMVTDINGKTVQQWQGFSQNQLQITGLKKGMYIIRVIDKNAGTTSNEKLVVN